MSTFKQEKILGFLKSYKPKKIKKLKKIFKINSISYKYNYVFHYLKKIYFFNYTNLNIKKFHIKNYKHKFKTLIKKARRKLRSRKILKKVKLNKFSKKWWLKKNFKKKTNKHKKILYWSGVSLNSKTKYSIKCNWAQMGLFYNFQDIYDLSYYSDLIDCKDDDYFFKFFLPPIEEELYDDAIFEHDFNYNEHFRHENQIFLPSYVYNGFSKRKYDTVNIKTNNKIKYNKIVLLTDFNQNDNIFIFKNYHKNININVTNKNKSNSFFYKSLNFVLN